MRIRFTANVLANLDAIDAFLVENGNPYGYDGLLAELDDVVLPNLSRFPRMGRLFLERVPDSVEAQRLHEAITQRLSPGDQIREYVMDDHLLLYRVNDQGVDLLAIRHHKQLAFDMQDFLHAPR
jgi:plasmid stabilization system protein ParE